MAVMVLPGDWAAARAGRRHLQAVCRVLETTPAVVDVALVLVSELVTNAVIHGRSSPRLHVETADSGALYVGVGDDNSRYPVVLDEDEDAISGRGLRLLEALASRWGVCPDPPGKVVWFELDGPAA
jgi:anti-sigma regulatory factor (Ser/Thr protein kinase)